MKRIALFLFWTLFAVTPVFAQSKPIYNPKILEAPGPVPDPITKVPQVASMAPWGYAISAWNSVYQFVTGETGTTEQKNFTIKTLNTNPDGENIENLATWLTPKYLQDNNLKLVTYQQHMTANHVNCFYDEDGGSEHRPDEKIFHPVAIQWNRIRSIVLPASHMTPFSLPIEGLDLFMTQLDEKVSPDNGLPCGTQTDNYKHIGLFEDGDNEQIYSKGDNNKMQWSADLFCPNVLKEYLQCIIDNKRLPPEDQVPCSLVCHGPAHTIYSTNIPDAKNIDKLTSKGEDNECVGFTCSYLTKSINNSERLLFRHGQNTQDHEVNIGPIGGSPTSEHSVYYGEYGRRQAMIAMRCSNTPRGAPGYNQEQCTFPTGEPTETQTQSCESEYFDKFKAGIEYSQQGKPADAGYNIPYRDASQSLTESMKEAAKKLAMEGYSGGEKAATNIDTYWDDINETAKANGWNPIFVVALWIEESGAGGHPNASHDLGCLYGWEKPNGQGPAVSMPGISEGSICGQMACLFSHPVKNKNDFSGFMCSYNSDPVSQGQYQCQASNGWAFAQNLKLVYDVLMGAK